MSTRPDYAVAIASPDSGFAVEPTASGGLPVAGAPLASATATIANGASLSGAVTLDGALVGILMPAAWTAASLSFAASLDGTNFFPVVDGISGTEYSLTVAAGQFIAMEQLGLMVGVRQVKLQSGTSPAPVNQGAARVLTLVSAP